MAKKAGARQDALCGTWWRVPEEDTPGVAVYRKEGSPLPPARGRRGFTLEKGGRAVLHGPGPIDRRENSESRWNLHPNGELHIDGLANVPSTVADVSNDKLILKE